MLILKASPPTAHSGSQHLVTTILPQCALTYCFRKLYHGRLQYPAASRLRDDFLSTNT